MVKPPLIKQENILLPILHIKSGVASKILQHFIKTNSNSSVTAFLKAKFGPYFEASNIQGKQVNQLIKDESFALVLRPAEKKLWNSFSLVVKEFLGKNRSIRYPRLVKQLMQELKKNDVGMTLKIHILSSHLNLFPTSNSDFSDEAGERFHQDIRSCVERNRGQSGIKLMADYVWRIHQRI